VLKLDIEGDRANGCATFLELSACEEQTAVFYLHQRCREVRVMKKILVFLHDFAFGRIARTRGFHDDTLRANQFADPRRAFSFWRALVS
jgi:hypothetical protein